MPQKLLLLFVIIDDAMKFLRLFLIFWTLFIGIGAVLGMVMMFISPSGEMWGMDPLLPMLQVLPFPEIFFTNFIFSGIVLFLVNGVTQLFSAVMLLRNNRYAPLFALVSGVILMLWCALEWVLFGFNFMTNIYFVFGTMETLNAVILMKLLQNEEKR